MAKAKLASEEMGRKRQCPSCSGRFYDLGKAPAECPYCETTFSPEDLLKGRRRQAVTEAPKPAQKPKKKPEEDEDDLPDVEDVELDDDDDDDDILEDASDLEDDDDVSDVVRKGDSDDDS